jgi:hypothetical protein
MKHWNLNCCKTSNTSTKTGTKQSQQQLPLLPNKWGEEIPFTRNEESQKTSLVQMPVMQVIGKLL